MNEKPRRMDLSNILICRSIGYILLALYGTPQKNKNELEKIMGNMGIVALLLEQPKMNRLISTKASEA